jgi:hypothetical protein
MQAIDVVALAVQVLLHDDCKHDDRKLLLVDPVGTIMRLRRDVVKRYPGRFDDNNLVYVGKDDD